MKRVAISDVLTSANSTSIAVAGTATVYTKAFKIPYAEYFSIFARVSSEGTVNVKLELEECWKLPAIEGSTDGDYSIPDGMATVMTLTDETQHSKSLSPIVTEYIRFKLTGLAGNDASTTLRLRLAKQEDW